MLLEVRDVSKIYGTSCDQCLELTGVEQDRAICPRCSSVVAINSISLFAQKNEILGIVGESGSGKSTLLQLSTRTRSPAAVKYFLMNLPMKTANR